MYKFSYTKSIAGKAYDINREQFHQLIEAPYLQQQCHQIAILQQQITAESSETQKQQLQEQISALKRKLPAICWHAFFDDGKRSNSKAHPSGLIMLDIDHIQDPKARYEQLVGSHKVTETQGLQLQGYTLLAAHITPSTRGLRLIFAIPPQHNLESAQVAIAHNLGITDIDACTKDLARLSFCVPKDYWLYIDEERLFEGDVDVRADNFCSSENANSNSNSNDSAKGAGSLVPGLLSLVPCPSSPSFLVEALAEQLGGIPAHGSRNNFIFAMAAHLRYVLGNNPDAIAQVLPTYGENSEKWRRTIESACQRSQNSDMPEIVKRAIKQAQRKERYGNATVDDDVPPALPRQLPPLIDHLVKNVPEVCKSAVATSVFPALATHLNKVKFWLIDGTEKEATFMCVNMSTSSTGKACINKPIEYIMQGIVERDNINREREQEWKDQMAQKGANKEKPKRPGDLSVQVLVSDMTNAAFVQRMKDANGKYLYTNLEELDLIKQLQSTGSKDIGKIICLCFDNGIYGQERVGTQSVTARVELRWNWNASSTIQKGIAFFKNRMTDGTLSRVNFCTIIRDVTKPFVYGRYTKDFATELKPYLERLQQAHGHIECPQALDMANRMLERCTEESALAGNDVFLELSFRAITIAYLKAMVLYVAHGMTWSSAIEEFAEWSLDYDLWCKMHYFGNAMQAEKEKERVKHFSGRQNLLLLLPNQFTLRDCYEMRRLQGLNDEGCKGMLRQWVFRGYIEYLPDLNIYNKLAFRDEES